MIYLVTNDDGIEAEGIRELVAAVGRRGRVVVVAPLGQLSECGHRVTTGRGLRVEKRAEGWYAVDGTPADCVRVGLLEILKRPEARSQESEGGGAVAGEGGTAERAGPIGRLAVPGADDGEGLAGPIRRLAVRPIGRLAVPGAEGGGDTGTTWGDVCVLSGVNESGNLGVDVYISGTVAAAREGAIWGVRSAAISQYKVRGADGKIVPPDWGWARRLTERVLEWMEGRELARGAFWNVNLPAGDGEKQGARSKEQEEEGRPGIVVCARSREPLPVAYAREGDELTYVTGRYAGRRREAGSDVEVCFGGGIAVTVERV